MRLVSALLAALFISISAPAPAETVPPGTTVSHGLSIYGDLKYPPDFTHFDYVNPLAPKGGFVKLSAVGTFDSLNPYILKGVPAAGLNLTFQTLCKDSFDEAASAYGLIAESVEMPADRSWVIFTLRKEARFHDGSPITPEDVIFSLDTIKTKGHPFYRAYYASVLKAEQVGEREVKFTFAPGNNRELPFIVANGLPILSKKFFAHRDFEKTTLEPLMGSGPYEVAQVTPGRSITYKRVKDYWAADLPVEKGENNFDTIRYDYYRDATVSLEAFKAGEYDFRAENTAKVWATGYDFPALRAGLVVKEELPNEQPTGMQAYVMNTREPKFQDPRVRRALAYAFDFEWTNAHLFYGAYTRTRSYFSNSELASRGLPDAAELGILDPFRDKVPPQVFTQEYEPPSTDVPGGIRTNLLKAQKLLAEAGWVVRDLKLVNEKTGAPFKFEVLLVQPAFERVTAPFIANLRRLGIDATMRTVDTSQYQNRVDNFDFDVIVDSFGQSLSPGNEQRDYWTTKAADTPGSRNTIGIKDPVVDNLVEQIIAAPDRAQLIARCRALDRVLLWHFYVIPQWHVRVYRVAYWDKFAHPKIPAKYALDFNSWWIDGNKAGRIEAAQTKMESAGGTRVEPGPVIVAAGSAGLLLWIVWRMRKAAG